MTDRQSRAQPRGRRVDNSSKRKGTSVSRRAADAAAARAPTGKPAVAPPPLHPTEARGTLSPTGMEQDPLQ